MNAMKTIKIFGIILATLVSPFSAQAETISYKPSFDCTKATIEIEKTICSVKALADADAELGLIYKNLFSNLPESEKNRLRKEQIEWLASRNTSCLSPKANVICIQNLYFKRMNTLDNWKTSEAEHSQWKVWSADGKGVSYSLCKLKKQKSVTENIENNILALHYDINWIKQDKEKKGEEFKLNLQVVPIGRWFKFEVYDVYNSVFQTKQIVLKAGEDDYRIIYSLWPISGEFDNFPPPPTEIKKVDGNEIIISKVHVWRDEHYEHYIYYDTQANAPVIKELVESIAIKAKGRINGKFKVSCETDIDQMTFYCHLFDIKADRLGDPYLKGKLTGTIGFDNGEIILRKETVAITPEK